LSFYYNYLDYCNKMKKSPSKVAEELGSSRASVNRWKNGSLPTDAMLIKIAQYFGCNVEQLKAEKPATDNGDGLSEADVQLISWFRSLPQEKQKAILTSLDAPEGLV